MSKKQDDPLTALRRKKLADFIKEHFNGNKSAAAHAAGKPPTQFVDLLNNPSRSFGARIARELEEKYRFLGMQKYYLDTENEQIQPMVAGPGWPFKFSRALFDALNRDQQLIIEGMVLGRIMGFHEESRAPAIPKRGRFRSQKP